MGYNRETTPTLDKMAKNGLCFTNAISSSIPTPASIFSIFTGEYALVDALDFNPNTWRKEFKGKETLASILSSKGYFTIGFTNNPVVSSLAGFDKGFQKYYDFVSSSIQGSHRMSFAPFDKVIRWYKHLSSFLRREWVYSTWEKTYSKILGELEKIKKPYFLWIFLLDTHVPYLTPASSRKWKTCRSLKMLYLCKKISDSYGRPSFSEEEKENLLNAYDNSIFHIDKFLRRLYKDTKDDDPIFVIHSDHGEGFGEHGFYEHHILNLYEELIHVPLVIYNSDLKGKIEKPVSLMDLFLIILDLISVGNELLSESLIEQKKEWAICKVFDRGQRKIAIRMKDWKFITGQRDEDELYHLKKDPYEQKNLIREHPRLAEEMKKIVKRHVKYETEVRTIKEKVRRLRK